jgi:hypothetical protein
VEEPPSTDAEVAKGEERIDGTEGTSEEVGTSGMVGGINAVARAASATSLVGMERVAVGPAVKAGAGDEVEAEEEVAPST